MIRTGIVKEKRGDSLRVCFERPDSCAGCRACDKGRMKRELLTVFGQAEVDDVVDVSMPDAQVLKASFLLYFVPLCGLLAGLGAGYAVGAEDTAAILMGFAGLAVCYGVIRVIETRLRRRAPWRPTVVEVRGRAEDGLLHAPCDMADAFRNTEKDE